MKPRLTARLLNSKSVFSPMLKPNYVQLGMRYMVLFSPKRLPSPLRSRLLPVVLPRAVKALLPQVTPSNRL